MKAKEMRSKKGEYHKNIENYMKKSILDLNSTPPPPSYGVLYIHFKTSVIKGPRTPWNFQWPSIGRVWIVSSLYKI